MTRTRSTCLSLLAFGLAFIIPGVGQGYELAPMDRIHEIMTRRSAACFAAAECQGVPVSDCARFLDVDPRLTRQKPSRKQIRCLHVGDEPLTYRELEIAVRWPDDPQRKLRRGRGAANFLTAIFSYCRRYVDRQSTVGEMGLLCASHFGSMQFLHAMASSSGEPTEETRDKALEWARFAYDFARGAIADNAELCVALASYPKIRGALVGSDDSFICKGNKRFPPRTVGQQFGFTCVKMLSSGRCGVRTSVAVRRRAALGAIFHLIQDSYAQGHVQRGSCGPRPDSPRPTIRVAPVERFLGYAEQDRGAHSASDRWPQTAVADPTMDHPVVAGARVLEMFAQGKPSKDLVEYLGARVLRLAHVHESVAGAGVCYERRSR